MLLVNSALILNGLLFKPVTLFPTGLYFLKYSTFSSSYSDPEILWLDFEIIGEFADLREEAKADWPNMDSSMLSKLLELLD